MRGWDKSETGRGGTPRGAEGADRRASWPIPSPIETASWGRTARFLHPRAPPGDPGNDSGESAGRTAELSRLLDALQVENAERRKAEASVLEQRRLAEFGRAIVLALTEAATLGAMLDRVARETVRHLDGAFARIWTADEAGETLLLRQRGAVYPPRRAAWRVPVGRYKIGLIARERRPHLTNGVIGDPRVPEQEWAKREGMVAFAGYPLLVEGRLVGVWGMFARHALSDRTLDAMAPMAGAISVGIERKRAAEALAASERWLFTTLSSIGDAVLATDASGRVRFMNAVAESLTGWERAEAVGRTTDEVSPLIDERTRLPIEHPVARVIRDRLKVELANHTSVVARDGSETPIEDSAAPILGDDGALAGVVMVFRDVTKERTARRLVLESEERYRTLVEVSPQAVWIGLPEGHITFCNRWWSEYTGLSMEESEGTGWMRAIHPEHRERVRDAWYDAAGKGEGYEIEIPFLRASDGMYRWHMARGMPVRDEAGVIVKWIGVAIDIDDRRAADVASRAAKEEAEEANRAKDQFLAVLSHELRTPLNPILLAASSMLGRPAPPEDVRPTFEMIRDNVILQSRLIDDLLDVMRIVRGKMPLNWEVADCHRLIERAVEICRGDIEGKALRLDLDLAAPRRLVNADAARLQQVFWNLIKNAVKFTPEGGAIAIRTRLVGGRIAVEVADDGIGIDPSVLPTVFDPFQQGESSITPSSAGWASGWRSARGSSTATAGLSPPRAPATARAQPSRHPRRPPRADSPRRKRPRRRPWTHPRRPRPLACGSWWWTTSRRPCGSWRGCCGASATRSAPPTRWPPPSRPSRTAPSTSSSATSAWPTAPAWT